MNRFDCSRPAATFATCLWLLIGFLLPAGQARAETADLTVAFPINSYPVVSGVCFRDGAMYAVTNSNYLLKYDPATGTLLEEVAGIVPGVEHAHPHGITIGADDTFWIGEFHSQRIYQFRFSDYSLVTSIAPPRSPAYGLAFKDGVLWVGYHSGEEPVPINAVDPQTEEVLVTIDIGATDIHGLAWFGDYLWVMDNGNNLLHKITASGEVLEIFEIPWDTYQSLASDGYGLWTSNLTNFFHVEVPPPSLCPEPGEVLGLGFADRATLTWTPPLQLGGSPVLYDTMRSDDPADFLTLAICVESDDGSDTTAVVDGSPLPGEVFYYLVRAENGCPTGQGPLGTGSDDEPREGRICQ